MTHRDKTKSGVHIAGSRGRVGMDYARTPLNSFCTGNHKRRVSSDLCMSVCNVKDQAVTLE